MSGPRIYTALLTAAFVLLWAGTSHAQLEVVELPEDGYWNVRLNTGIMMAESELIAAGVVGGADDILVSLGDDDLDLAYGVGGELMYRFDTGWTLGGQFAWSPIERDFNAVEIDGRPTRIDRARDLDLYLYSLNAGYSVSEGRVGGYATAGIGGATQAFNQDQLVIDGRDVFNEASNTNLMSPLSLGLQFAISRSMTVDITARDYIIFADQEVDDTTNNFYLGGGLSFAF